jgi:MFS family permease
MNFSTFRAFQSRNYRLYFAGQSISLIGTWMQKTAVSWIVYLLTHSTFMLGLSLFASQFPSFLLSLLGGVVSDRYNRFKVLLITQIASMIQSLGLATLVLLGHYRVWEIILLGTVLGTINAFDVPARQALVYDMIDDKRDLPNALALNSSMVNLSRLIGPAIAGIVLENLGGGVCFLLNAASFVAVIGSLLLMSLPPYVQKPHTQKVLGDLKEGLRYLRNTPTILHVIVMLMAMSLLVLPFTTLLPVYAKVIFKGNASTFGVIDSFIGLGALGGAIFLASLKRGTSLRKILLINTILLGAGLILFSHETWLPLALAFATLCGFGMMSQTTISNTIIQVNADPAMRGRVISFFAMSLFGTQPIGSLLIGGISGWIGTPDTILAEGLAALGVVILSWSFLKKRPPLREQEKAPVHESDIVPPPPGEKMVTALQEGNLTEK